MVVNHFNLITVLQRVGDCKMCKHTMRALWGNVKFCPKCGLVVLDNKLFYIDKKLKERGNKREKRK